MCNWLKREVDWEPHLWSLSEAEAAGSVLTLEVGVKLNWSIRELENWWG